MAATDAQKKASAKYKKANSRNYTFTLSLKYDKDIINHLETISNKTSYIKELIRKDILIH